MNDDCAIIVFAKAPLPGYAKTRLIPVLGERAAARLAQRMLHETLSSATRAGVGPVELCCAPDARSRELQEAAERYGVTLTVQGDGDLGVRMHRALARRLATERYALVIGTDCPGLAPDILQQAARCLHASQAVFVPAFDGGYVLAGLALALPSLFTGIAWSTGAVMAQTREQIAVLGVRAAELPWLHDIDEPADLVHVPKEWLA